MNNWRYTWLENDIKFLIENYSIKSNKELSTILNKTISAISSKATELGLHKSIVTSGLHDAEISKIKELYQQGKSISEIEQLIGYSYRTIVKYIPNRRSHSPKTEDVVNTYRINGTLDGTAKLLGYSTTAIWRHLKKAKIEVGNGAKDSKRLYSALRARTTKSKWRKNILERDNYKCIRCGKDSKTVHHIDKLSVIRDRVFMKNPNINPLRSYKELRIFTDAVMAEHKEENGVVLCNNCHDKEHSNK